MVNFVRSDPGEEGLGFPPLLDEGVEPKARCLATRLMIRSGAITYAKELGQEPFHFRERKHKPVSDQGLGERGLRCCYLRHTTQ